MTATGVTDDELREVLAPRGDVTSLRRRPHAYATTWPLEQVDVGLSTGEQLALILKELDWARLSDDARRAKSRRVHHPARELETYRLLLSPAGLGPPFHGGRHDAAGNRAWLLVDRVEGVELWQIGDLARWVDVARWLASFHVRFRGGHADDVHPTLVRYDADAFQRSAAEALAPLAASTDERVGAVVDRLATYRAAVARLHAGESTLVHGELYPSNVLVGTATDHTEVWPVDWEVAGTGPGALDVAALCAGWEPEARAALLHGYAGAVGTDPERLAGEVAVCTVHLALQWIARSKRWRPPAEHATDWVGEALTALEVLRP